MLAENTNNFGINIRCQCDSNCLNDRACWKWWPRVCLIRCCCLPTREVAKRTEAKAADRLGCPHEWWDWVADAELDNSPRLKAKGFAPSGII